MTEARGFVRKAHLTPEEKLKCAYFHMIRGFAQSDLADLFNVNSGRVAEAIMLIRTTLKMEDDDPRLEL
jgi:hypothetical protein